MSEKISKKNMILLGAIVISAFIIGYIVAPAEIHNHEDDSKIVSSATKWTCSMHPQIRQNEPGKCPICGMDLIPVASDDNTDGEKGDLRLSDYSRKLAEIQTYKVERKFVEKEIRMVGKISYDETKINFITSRVPGRIERMYVDYTGVMVRKGDHLVNLYSPELVSTQHELLQTQATLKNNNSKLLADNLNSIRERLRLWGLTNTQINNLEKSGKVSENITIYADRSGVVIDKNGFNGMYIKEGTRIYTIADLDQVWLKLSAYETDIPWIRYGQSVQFTTGTGSGEIFDGLISYIDPVLDENTRTVNVRVNVSNKDGKLKPGMFVKAMVRANIAAEGRVISPQLAGKWISPMHPEVIKDKPGACDVCGMPLVKAEDLGYVRSDNIKQQASLVIPATAPLITGKRAIVYIELPGGKGVYEGREVHLGPRAGDYYIILDGLKEGEKVVVNGNFKIDSAIQLLAKSSMMNPENNDHAHLHENISMQTANDTLGIDLTLLDPLYIAYLSLQNSLSHDNHADAVITAEVMASAYARLLKAGQDEIFQDGELFVANLTAIQNSKNLDYARNSFKSISDQMIHLARQYGSSGNNKLLLYHCPMAFENSGADWLQSKSGTENPYFGSQMFSCGSEKGDLTFAGKKN